MKKLFILIFAFSLSGSAMSQSTGEAKTLIKHERFNSAENMLHQLLKADPNNAEAWYLLTQTYLRENKVSGIRDSFTKAPATVLDEPMMKVANGHIMLYEDKPAEARVLFDQALKETKQKNPDVLYAVAYANFDAEKGDAAYAKAAIEKAIKRDKKNPAVYVLLGDINRKLLNGSEAYRAYEQALSLDDGNPEANYKMGKIFVSQNNPEFYLKYFNKAVAADPQYAPALYELYYHYYFRDVNQAMDFLKKYIAASDPDVKNDYMVTDLLYASKKYDEAIRQATALINKQGEAAEPRLYKLVAYSYEESGKPEQAMNYMNTYFNKEQDSNYVVKDFDLMGEIYSAFEGKEDSAAVFFEKALQRTASDTVKADYYKKLAELYKKTKNYEKQADWLEKYYAANINTSNVDLFNLGVARYMSEDFSKADSVFMVYAEKYPEQQGYGYYWRARSNVALDSNMAQGLAIPHYLKVIELAEKDTANDVNKKRLIEAYGYIAAYKANTEKDYEAAVDYFEKLLTVAPENEDARKYIDILKKNIASNNTESK